MGNQTGEPQELRREADQFVAYLRSRLQLVRNPLTRALAGDVVDRIEVLLRHLVNEGGKNA